MRIKEFIVKCGRHLNPLQYSKKSDIKIFSEAGKK
jgi:hypothetical protein